MPKRARVAGASTFSSSSSSSFSTIMTTTTTTISSFLLLLLLCLQQQGHQSQAQAISPSRLLQSFAFQQQQRAAFMTGRGGATNAGHTHTGAGSHGRTPHMAFRDNIHTHTSAYPSYSKRMHPHPPSTMKNTRNRRSNNAVAFVGGNGGGGADGDFWGTAGRDWGREVAGIAGGTRRPREVASSMGVSGLSGMAAGYVAKRFGKFLSFACGFLLVSMKVAEEAGYVAVNWEKIEHDVHGLGQSFWGQEGKVRRKAEKLARSWQNEFAPSAGIAGSFLAGFAYAFKAT